MSDLVGNPEDRFSHMYLYMSASLPQQITMKICYHYFPKFLDIVAQANSVDIDYTASRAGLGQHLLETFSLCKSILFEF